jgi:hypothetical protein
VKQSELASISNHGGLTGQPISENLLEADPSFPGLHSPSHRKEDVTELFSAFVFQIEVQPRELDEKMQRFAPCPDWPSSPTEPPQPDLGRCATSSSVATDLKTADLRR